MNAEAREETFRKALKLALGEAVREEWEELSSHHVRHPVSLRCRLKMKQILSGRSVNQTTRTLTKKIGIGILVALAVFAMLGMAIPPVREAVVRAVFNWYDTHFGVRYEPEDPVPTVVEDVILPAWLPDGWTVRELSVNFFMADHILAGEDGERIHLTQHPIDPDEETDWFDNTDVTIETILLNGTTEARLFSYADGRRTLTWTDRYVFILSCISESVSVETLISIAESMKSTKEKR